MEINIRRTNGLVGVLRVFLGLEGVRSGRQIRMAELRLDPFTDSSNGLGRYTRRVGTHIGDETDRLAANVHALIQALGDAHRALDIKSKLARCVLLEFAGSERCSWIALALF